MPDQPDWKRRLEDKSARKALRELYGGDAGQQAGRYLSLAELAEGDVAAVGVAKVGAADSGLRFYSAPGRTELGGNHTDHNRGRVLCAAVSLDIVACVAASKGEVVRLISEGYPAPITVDLSSLDAVPAERGTTAALVRGVARGLADYAGANKLRGTKPIGFTGRLSSTVLPGSGLSSSAAIEVLMGTIMADLAGIEVPPLEMAKIGQFAENEYFGKPCGLMDQTASAVGGIVIIDFADPAAPKFKRFAYDFAEEGYDLVVVNSGGSHADLTADYAAIPDEMKSVAEFMGSRFLRDVDPASMVARGPAIREACGDRAFLRSLHFVAENGRVAEMAKALVEDKLGAYLKLVRKSGSSSWRLLQNLYSPSAPSEQGLPVALALSEEFLGRKGASRVHGGGFAGTIQAYVPKKRSASYAALMESFFGPLSVIPVSIRASGALRVRI